MPGTHGRGHLHVLQLVAERDHVVVARVVDDHDRAGAGDAARRRVDDVADILEAHRRRPRQPGDHRLRVAHRHHAGGEDVAVLVHHALAVALQQATALLTAVEVVEILTVVA